MIAAVLDERPSWIVTWRAGCLGALLCATSALPQTTAPAASAAGAPAAGAPAAGAPATGVPATPAAPNAGAGDAPDTSEDIRDIRGPKAVPAGWPLSALIVGALLLAAAGFAVWYWRGRAKRVRVLTLTEQTLQRLEATRPLMQPATAREFGIAASEIVRTYIERKFEVVATQRTTEEFLQSLLQDTHAALAGYRPLLSDFLQQCDFVKFAGVSLTSPDMESLFQSARRFVLETGQPVAA